MKLAKPKPLPPFLREHETDQPVLLVPGVMYRVLVCGDREWNKQAPIVAQLHRIAKAEQLEAVIEGDAPGADTLAGRAADALIDAGYPVVHLTYPAEWQKYGRAAGPIRNKQMITEGKPNLVLAFHSDLIRSKGTRDMLRQAHNHFIHFQVFTR